METIKKNEKFFGSAMVIVQLIMALVLSYKSPAFNPFDDFFMFQTLMVLCLLTASFIGYWRLQRNNFADTVEKDNFFIANTALVIAVLVFYNILIPALRLI